MPFCYSPDDASAFYSVPWLVQPVDLMTRRSYSSWGWRISGYGVLCAAVISFVGIAIALPCGISLGLLGGGGPHECSFNPSLYAMFTVGMAIDHWPILLGIVFGPPIVGYSLVRRRE